MADQFIKKSIYLYSKDHDGQSLIEGNACELPTSSNFGIYWFKMFYSGTIVYNGSGAADYNGVTWEISPDFEIGPGAVPSWTLTTLANEEVDIYTSNDLTDLALPGKYSQIPFPSYNFDPSDNEDAYVYSWLPPVSIPSISPNNNWEHLIQYVIGGQPGETETVLQEVVCTPSNPVLLDVNGILGNPGEVELQLTALNPCDVNNSSFTQSGVVFFPTDDVPAGSTLEDVVNAGLPLYFATGNIINNFYVSNAPFPSNSSDVTLYLATQANEISCDWQESICTQIVAPDETIHEFTTKYSSGTDVGLQVDTDSNPFCVSESSLRIFYANDNVVYNSVEELMRAQETIYVANFNIAEGVTPEFWQLIEAPQGSYGLDDNRFFLYLPTFNDKWQTFQFGSTTGQLVPVNQSNSPSYCTISNVDLFQTRTIDLLYSESFSDYCNSSTVVTCQYLNPFGIYDLTLSEIILNQIPIYIADTQTAAYYGIDEMLLDSGFYGEDGTHIFYEFNSSLVNSFECWRGRESVTISESYSLPYLCEGVLQTIDLYSINPGYFIEFPDYDFTYEWCYRKRTNASTYYYSFPTNLTLDQIVQYGIQIYQDLLSNNPITYSSYSDDIDYYYAWIPNSDEDGGLWQGLNSAGILSSSFIAGPIICDINPPTTNPFDDYDNNDVVVDVPVALQEYDVFYVFRSCIPVNGQYKSYLVNGGHTNLDPGGEIYEFTQTLGIGNSFWTFGQSTDIEQGCKTFLGRVFASSSVSAITFLQDPNGNTPLFTPQNLPIEVQPYSIGMYSEGTLLYFGSGCDECLNSFDIGEEYNLGEFEDGLVEIEYGPRFGLENNYNLHNISKPLLRTNPKLTGNVKLVVTNDDEIYLESINATKDLADSRYKKYGINSNSSYSYDVSRFFNDNKTPYDITYSVKRVKSDFSVLDSYDLQYEDEYHYGVRFNKSKLYSEDFRIFAPIWLDTNIPKKFVVYRVNTPKPVQSLPDSAENMESRILEMLSNSTIVKTFDLSERSNIGKYIRNHVYDEAFQDSPMIVSFEENEQTFFNGIDLVKGGFSSKGEFIYKDYVATDKPLIEANDFITDGFRRNRIISSNILNLEFMFDDDSAKDYSVNRYFGVFVDEIPSGKGKVARLNDGLIKFKELVSYMDDSDPTFAIPSNKLTTNVPVLGYIKCDIHYHNILNGSAYDEDNYTLKVSVNDDDISRFTGIKSLNKTVTLKEKAGAGYDFIKIDLVDIPFNGDKLAICEIKKQSYKINFVTHVPGLNHDISISYPVSASLSFNSGADETEGLNNIKQALETLSTTYNIDAPFDIEIEGQYLYIRERLISFEDHHLEITNSGPCVIKVFENYTREKLTENLFIADDSIDKARSAGNRFSNVGNIKDIVISLSSAINRVNGLSTIVSNGSIYIYSDSMVGYDTMKNALLVSKSNVNSFIVSNNLDETGKIGTSTSINDNWEKYYFIGGHSHDRSVLLSRNSVGGISIGDYLSTKSATGFNKVVDIVEDIDDLRGDYVKLVMSNKHVLGSGEFNVFSEQEIEIGLFSAYSMYDMNFDFYDTSNSELKELKYETYQNTNYVPANTAIEQALVGEEEVALDNIIDPDYLKSPQEFFTGLSPILNRESPLQQVNTTIKNEYDRLQENNVKEFSTESRIVPYINKWILKDSTNVRNNPYYLNSNEAFGRTNFSPDITIEGRNRRGFTHEWFYIVDKPDYLEYFMINETFSYVNFVKGYNLLKDYFKSVENDYFNKFMVGEGFDTDINPESSYFNVTFSSTEDGTDTIFINDSQETQLLTIGARYYFNLSALTDPDQFTIGSIQSDVQSILVGGVPHLVYTPSVAGQITFSYSNATGILFVSQTTSRLYSSFIKTNRDIKYTIASLGNDSSFASTIFKGLKITFKPRKEFENKVASEFLKDSSFNSYKFSVLVKFNTNSSKSNIDYEVIKNDKFKFIIFYITVNIDESYVGNTLNRRLLYLLDNQLALDGENYIADDVNISGALDISNIDFNQLGPYIIQGIDHFNGSSPDFLTQISTGSDNTFGQLQIDYLIEDENGNPIVYYLDIVSVLSNDQLIVSGPPTDVNGNEISPVYVPLSLQEIANYTYIGGGTNAHNTLLNKLSINYVTNLINSKDPSIKYTTITEDGSELNNRFTISIEDGKEIVRASKLIAKPDSNKPKSYSLYKGTIGYNIEERNEYYPFIIRHSGKYTLDMKPVVTFTDVYTHFKVNRDYSTNLLFDEKLFKSRYYKHAFDIPSVNRARAYYKKYNRTNVAFNVGFIADEGLHDSSWGMIKNHFYHKVNEDNSTGVTKLSESGEFLPKYPLIGEIAIDKRDINVFRSSWEDDYYVTSLSGGDKQLAPGTFSTLESKSYLASTVMKLKESYTITEFTYSDAGSFENLDSIRKNKNNTTEIVFSEDSERIFVDFYMTDIISALLSRDGVKDEITRYVSVNNSFNDKTDIEDDVKSYISNNLIRLFSVDQVDLYTLKTQSQFTGISVVSSVDLVDNGGFIEDINYTIEQHRQTPINFRLIYNKGLGYSYIIRPVIKIKQ